MMLRRYHKKRGVIQNEQEKRSSQAGREEGPEIETKQEDENKQEGEALEKKTVAELKEIAKDKDIESYNNMKKDELVKALKEGD